MIEIATVLNGHYHLGREEYEGLKRLIELVRMPKQQEAGEVIAIGEDAPRWSSGAATDKYGFRELPIPKSNKLSHIVEGFGAKTITGDWYIGSTKTFNEDVYDGNNLDYYTSPKQYPVSGIISMTGGNRLFNSTQTHELYFAYMTLKGLKIITSTAQSNQITNITYTTQDDIKGHQKGYSYGLALINQSNEIKIFSDNNNTITPDGEVINAAVYTRAGTDSIVFYVTKDGKLYKVEGTGTPEQIMPEAGKVVDVWLAGAGMNVYFLTETHDLYARGDNQHYELGLPEAKYYKDFTLVGNYDVKKMSGNFMLMNDGSLYHSGDDLEVQIGITDEHKEFTHIYPDYKFLDMEYLYMPNSAFEQKRTLVAIKAVSGSGGGSDEDKPIYKPNLILGVPLLDYDTPDKTKSINLTQWLSGVTLGSNGVNEVSYFFASAGGQKTDKFTCYYMNGAYNYACSYNPNTGCIEFTPQSNIPKATNKSPTDSNAALTLYITTNKGVYAIQMNMLVNTPDNAFSTGIGGTSWPKDIELEKIQYDELYKRLKKNEIEYEKDYSPVINASQVIVMRATKTATPYTVRGHNVTKTDKITQVIWSAKNIPDGVIFDEQTGTFSGSVDVEGEYLIPVTVKTNYGQDTKIIKLQVRPLVYNSYEDRDDFGEVYIFKGREAWSKFEKHETLSPLVSLQEHPYGFAGKTTKGEYYCEGIYDLTDSEDILDRGGWYKLSNVLVIDSKILPNVEQMIYAFIQMNLGSFKMPCLLWRKTDGTLEVKTGKIRYGEFDKEIGTFPPVEYEGNCSLLCGGYEASEHYFAFTFLSDDNRVEQTLTISTIPTISGYANKYTITSQELGYKVKKYLGYKGDKTFTYLSEDGYIDNTPENFTEGKIRDAFRNFVVTEDNDVYEYGRHWLNTSQFVTEWMYMGTYPVKKICFTSTEVCMLTTDGRLYLHGAAEMDDKGRIRFDGFNDTSINVVKDFSDGFTQIFPDDYFYDMTTFDDTIVVLKPDT